MIKIYLEFCSAIACVTFILSLLSIALVAVEVFPGSVAEDAAALACLSVFSLCAFCFASKFVES